MPEARVQQNPPPKTSPLLWPTRLCIVLAAALLGLGLIGPCMTIRPGMGEFESWVRLLKPVLLRPSTYSVLGGIDAMIRHGNAGIGTLLLVFSCLFPIAKLALMAYAQQQLATAARPGRWLGAVHQTGKFSMLDVLVLAVIVVAMKGLPGNSTVTLHWGIWAFAGSVLLSLAASVLLTRMEATATPAAP